MPGSELAVCRSSVPWLRITHKGSDWVVPLGSNKTTWNFLKSVEPISWFNGQGSSTSGTLSLSKSSKQALPLLSPVKKTNRGPRMQTFFFLFFGMTMSKCEKFCVMVERFNNPLCMMKHTTESSKTFDSNINMTWITGEKHRHSEDFTARLQNPFILKFCPTSPPTDRESICISISWC